jgi:ParB-like chromosome segregation protein Spo0J
MLERHNIEIARIRVPAKRMRTLDRARAESIAEDILEHGQTTPVQVRLDRKDHSGQYVLVEGLHRLEALRSLGEATIVAYLVQARIR